MVYDQNFRQEAASNPTQSWAKVDPGIYKCRNWCSKCQGLDHTSDNCPYRQRNRPWSVAMGAGASQPPGKPGREPQVCIKFNKFNGDCKFGKECRYLHVCSGCGEPHPISRCKATKGSGITPGQSAPTCTFSPEQQ